MRTKIRSSFAVVAIVALAGMVASAGEEKIKPDDLPKSVASSLNDSISRSHDHQRRTKTESDGKVVFDIELKQKDRKFETDIQKDGTILEVEKEIFVKDWSDGFDRPWRPSTQRENNGSTGSQQSHRRERGSGSPGSQRRDGRQEECRNPCFARWQNGNP